MIRQLKKLFDWLRERKIRTIDIIFVILLATSYMISVLFGADINLDFNFDLNTKIDVGYCCTLDKEGGLYIVDNGQERLFKVKNNKVEWEIIVGKEDKICEIENVAVDDDSSSIYVYETQWDETGFLINNEAIHKYGCDGKYIETKYSLQYDENDKKEKPRLFDLRFVDGNIEYIRLNDYGFEAFKLVNGEPVLKSKCLFNDAITFIQDIAVSSKTNNIYMVDKRGKILCADNQGNIYTYYEFKDDVVPYDLEVGLDESIYFTNLRSKSVEKISPKKELEEVFSNKSVFKNENMDKNMGFVLRLNTDALIMEDGTNKDVICGIFDVGILYAVTQDGKIVYNQSNFEASEGYFISKLIAFIAPIIVTFCMMILGIRLIFVTLFNRSNLNIVFLIENVIVLTTAVVLIAILPVFL